MIWLERPIWRSFSRVKTLRPVEDYSKHLHNLNNPIIPIYSHDGSPFSAGGNMWIDPGNI